MKDRFGVEIAQGYGLTETSPVVTLGRGVPVRPTSVGRVLPGVDVALVDDSGTPVDVGDEGEIVVRSPGVFLGYLDDQETTDSVLSEDGWLWTGDVGIFDDDGYLYLVDRIKDIVIVSGFNVYPAEVENVLMQHPGVSGAIVTGTADEATGETVVAHIVGHRDARGVGASLRRATQSVQTTHRVPLPRRTADRAERQGHPTGAALMGAPRRLHVRAGPRPARRGPSEQVPVRRDPLGRTTTVGLRDRGA